jgi:hypothetical protein
VADHVWRVVQHNWKAGYSLHRNKADAFAFIQAYYDSKKSNPNQEAIGVPFYVQVDKDLYDAIHSGVGDTKYGIWGQ